MSTPGDTVALSVPTILRYYFRQQPFRAWDGAWIDVMCTAGQRSLGAAEIEASSRSRIQARPDTISTIRRLRKSNKQERQTDGSQAIYRYCIEA